MKFGNAVNQANTLPHGKGGILDSPNALHKQRAHDTTSQPILACSLARGIGFSALKQN